MFPFVIPVYNELEITFIATRLECRFNEIDIGYSDRMIAEREKINWKDVVWAIRCIRIYR